MAALLRMTEGQILKLCWEDICTMVPMKGAEKIPHIVNLLRAAEEYENSAPSMPLQKLDKSLRSGYAKGTYKIEPSCNSLVAEESPKKVKK